MILSSFTGCKKTNDTIYYTDITTNMAESMKLEPTAEELSKYFSSYDTDTDYTNTSYTTITLTDTSVDIKGSGVTANGSIVTIAKEGCYVLSGKLSDGQIIVSLDKTEKAWLVFNGIDITCSVSSPIYIVSADKVKITLAEGSANNLTDSANYIDKTENAPAACLYSKDDLTVNGNGSLTVKGLYNNGISTANDLKIAGGTISVSAINNAIKGKDSVIIGGGKITVTASDDALKSDNETEAGQGYIVIIGGYLELTSLDDALQAVVSIDVTGGYVITHAGGEAVNCDGSVNIDSSCILIK